MGYEADMSLAQLQKEISSLDGGRLEISVSQEMVRFLGTKYFQEMRELLRQ